MSLYPVYGHSTENCTLRLWYRLQLALLANADFFEYIIKERAIARHEVREIEQRHTVDGPRQEVTLDEEDDVVIIYNRVPKTASTSFTNIAYDLCAKNKYHVLHINTTKNNPVMSLQDQ
ncbi:PREDICTED: heparan sulfate 2-O-sulfotransferase 1-like, partial [Chlamydotis macqueenii]|uniref:heparan sulfate 2-O-sulfotransferase 1-like n=1 Tax=Chlamydotis macqueenii TaxID=187382 RepID=UPI0005295E42